MSSNAPIHSHAPPLYAKSSLANFENIAVNLLHLLALPTEILLRKEFGVRYLRIFHTNFLSVTLTILWVLVLLLAPVMLGSKEMVLSFFYLLIVAVMASIHALEIYRRPKRGVTLHSYYTGYPRLMDFMSEGVKTKLKEWGFTPEIFLKMYGEPVLCLVAARLIFPFDPLLSMFFGIGGISLYICGQYRQAEDEDKLLDLLDAEIKAGMLQEDLTSCSGSFGVESYAPRAKVLSPEAKAKPQVAADDAMPQLPPELKNLVEEEEDEDDEQAQARPQATVRIENLSARKETNVDVTPVARPRGRPRKDSAIYP